MKRVLSLLVIVALGGCAGRGAVESPVPRNPLGDPQLYRLLAPVPLEGAAVDSLAAYELAHTREFLERVATVAEDPAAAAAVRQNAVLLLGERGALAYLPSLRIAQRASDPGVRGAVIVAARNLVQADRPEARGLIVAALDDPAPEIQAKALELLGAEDVPLLRDFLQRHDRSPAAAVALDLLHVAEERGHPLEPDSAGTLRRQAHSGHGLEFRPERRWEQWGAALGTVTITPVQGAPLRIDSVEVVGNVVPVAFSPDGRHVAWERGRRIHVHDLQSGTTRDLGPGLAPRARPFTGDLMFVRERPGARHEVRERTRITYDVVRAPFDVAEAEPNPMGSVGAYAQMDRHGGYSPVRWMHIAERDLVFRLGGEGLEEFILPDAFSGRSEP